MKLTIIYLAADHGGYHLKNKIKTRLMKNGYNVTDLGASAYKRNDDYPMWAKKLVKNVRQPRRNRGILFCRSGVGMAIVANRYPGIRAVQGSSERIAAASRRDENTNVLTVAADHQPIITVIRIIKKWLATKYRPQKRHERRMKMIEHISYGR